MFYFSGCFVRDSATTGIYTYGPTLSLPDALPIWSIHPVLKGDGAYGASKAGLNALVRAAARDHAEDGIRVNAVLPGAVPVGDPPADMERLGGPATQPGRLMLGMGSAEDVASAIVYLAPPAGRLITGPALALDGGSLKIGRAESRARVVHEVEYSVVGVLSKNKIN